jgi:transcriptional regulator of acetoin/glycerol metabolism
MKCKLELNGGNQAQTAAQLDIGTATLYRRLKKYGVVGRFWNRQRTRTTELKS